jgi:hypothetical protein
MAKMQDLFGFEQESTPNENEEKKASSPIYEPKKGNIILYSCFDRRRYDRLMRMIDMSNVDEEEKEFLRMAALRFVEFNYESIADYYANNASNEMQQIMEELNLVIIDNDREIEDGFNRLNQKLREIYEEELEDARHE